MYVSRVLKSKFGNSSKKKMASSKPAYPKTMVYNDMLYTRIKGAARSYTSAHDVREESKNVIKVLEPEEDEDKIFEKHAELEKCIGMYLPGPFQKVKDVMGLIHAETQEHISLNGIQMKYIHSTQTLSRLMISTKAKWITALQLMATLLDICPTFRLIPDPKMLETLHCGWKDENPHLYIYPLTYFTKSHILNRNGSKEMLARVGRVLRFVDDAILNMPTGRVYNLMIKMRSFDSNNTKITVPQMVKMIKKFPENVKIQASTMVRDTPVYVDKEVREPFTQTLHNTTIENIHMIVFSNF